MSDGCVQFSKNSWHFKLVNLVFPYYLIHYNGAIRQVNLCPYMRRVIAGILSVAFVVPWRKLPYRIQDNAWLVQAELIFFAIILIGAFTFDVVDTMNKDVFPDFWTMVLIGFIGGNIVGVVGGLLMLGVTSLKDYIDGRPKKEHRTRGLIKTYMQSKHERICPCVEFEE